MNPTRHRSLTPPVPRARRAPSGRTRRSGGPDRDNASYRFTLDGEVCVVAVAGIACTDADGAPSRVFVAADVTEEGVGRTFRVDTLGRASSHLVIQRNEVTIDEVDHQPTLVRPCGGFAFDRGQERVLPE